MQLKIKKEIFYKMPDFDNYYISKKSNIVSTHNKKRIILRQYQDRYGYLKVILHQNAKPHYFTVHRVMALVFFGKSKLQVNHIDHDRKNNNIENLEYMTPKQNIRHGMDGGLIKLNGTNNPNSKTSEKEIISIGLLLERKVPMYTISKILNIPTHRIQYYKNKKEWLNYEVIRN